MNAKEYKEFRKQLQERLRMQRQPKTTVPAVPLKQSLLNQARTNRTGLRPPELKGV